jgi:hypothetical protein
MESMSAAGRLGRELRGHEQTHSDAALPNDCPGGGAAGRLRRAGAAGGSASGDLTGGAGRPAGLAVLRLAVLRLAVLRLAVMSGERRNVMSRGPAGFGRGECRALRMVYGLDKRDDDEELCLELRHGRSPGSGSGGRVRLRQASADKRC